MSRVVNRLSVANRHPGNLRAFLRAAPAVLAPRTTKGSHRLVGSGVDPVPNV